MRINKQKALAFKQREDSARCLRDPVAKVASFQKLNDTSGSAEKAKFAP
jgi:hypothetical protein